MLPKIDINFIDTQTKDDILATQFKLQYSIGVAMQNNAAQYWLHNTILPANTILNIYR